VIVSNFGFTSPAPCFTAPLGQKVTFTASGHSGGFETGPFGMNIATGLMTPVENVLTLTGSRNSSARVRATGLLQVSGDALASEVPTKYELPASFVVGARSAAPATPARNGLFPSCIINWRYLEITPNSLFLHNIKLPQHFLTLWVSSDVATMQVRITN
jgi:hypothetical protein